MYMHVHIIFRQNFSDKQIFRHFRKNTLAEAIHYIPKVLRKGSPFHGHSAQLSYMDYYKNILWNMNMIWYFINITNWSFSILVRVELKFPWFKIYWSNMMHTQSSYLYLETCLVTICLERTRKLEHPQRDKKNPGLRFGTICTYSSLFRMILDVYIYILYIYILHRYNLVLDNSQFCV